MDPCVLCNKYRIYTIRFRTHHNIPRNVRLTLTRTAVHLFCGSHIRMVFHLEIRFSLTHAHKTSPDTNAGVARLIGAHCMFVFTIILSIFDYLNYLSQTTAF